MAKFRKKPILVEAEQFDLPRIWGWPDVPEGMEYDFDKELWYIETLEGVLHVSRGDWIITGIQGEHYPCKPDIFEQTYEALDG